MLNGNKSFIKKDAGFTLIEITFVLIIFGLMLAMFFPLYSLYLKNQAELTTRQNTELIVSEITEFLNVNGRYPCPAPPGVPRTESEYGRESTECEAPHNVAADSCQPSGTSDISGICIETSQNTSLSGVDSRVIIGAVPFRELNIPEDASYDGYQNKITYAVTEVLARRDSFDVNLGGIRIQDQNEVDIDDEYGIHFIVYSHGANGFGAWNNNGERLACNNAAGTDGEVENCVGTDAPDAHFRIAQRSTNYSLTEEYDDVAAFIGKDDIPYTALIEGSDDLVFMNTDGSNGGKVSKGLPGGMEATPDRELDVGGAVRAQEKLKADKLCTYGNDAECFNTVLIAGEYDESAGEIAPLKCPPGEFIVRIENNTVVCQSEVTPSCPEGEYVVGIRSNGDLNCAPYDAPDCKEVEIDICPDNPGTQKLPVGHHGDKVDKRERNLPTVNKRHRYKCQNGTWDKVRTWGRCDCDSTEELDRKTLSCGQCQSGTYDRVTYRNCPKGSRTVRENDNCSCDPSTTCSDTRTDTCAPGYTLVGNPRIEESIFQCSASGEPQGWGNWSLVPGAGTCDCVPASPQIGQMACSELEFYLTERVAGKLIPTIRKFSCADNAFDDRELDDNRADSSVVGSGLYSSAVENHYCECNTGLSSQTRKQSCSSRFPNTAGTIDEKRDFDCAAQKWSDWYPDHENLDENSTPADIKAEFCTDLPPVICRWDKGEKMGKQPYPGYGVEWPDTCDCDTEAGDSSGCYEVLPGGSEVVQYTGCICG